MISEDSPLLDDVRVIDEYVNHADGRMHWYPSGSDDPDLILGVCGCAPERPSVEIRDITPEEHAAIAEVAAKYTDLNVIAWEAHKQLLEGYDELKEKAACIGEAGEHATLLFRHYARTSYPAPADLRNTDENDNAPSYMCWACFADSVEHWDSMWDDYYAGIL